IGTDRALGNDLRLFLLNFRVCVVMLLFFFSSRRRHTRCLSDWSSDVCSSDFKGLRYERGAELLNANLVDIDHDFLLFDCILGLTALLAAMGVLNGLLLSALERTKELGVLKALGTSRRQITGMVLCESAVVGLLGGLLG